MNTNWIKIAERAPEFPAWLWAKDTEKVYLYHGATGNTLHESFVYWQPAQIPAPPPKELTQAEKDTEAYWQWTRSATSAARYSNAWYAALKWEREQVDDDFFEALFRWRDNDRDTREQDEFLRDFFRARREGGKT